MADRSEIGSGYCQGWGREFESLRPLQFFGRNDNPADCHPKNSRSASEGGVPRYPVTLPLCEFPVQKMTIRRIVIRTTPDRRRGWLAAIFTNTFRSRDFRLWTLPFASSGSPGQSKSVGCRAATGFRRADVLLGAVLRVRQRCRPKYGRGAPSSQFDVLTEITRQIALRYCEHWVSTCQPS